MKRNCIEVESDVTMLVEFLKIKYHLKTEDFTPYPQDVVMYMQELEQTENEEDYKKILEKILLSFKENICYKES